MIETTVEERFFQSRVGELGLFRPLGPAELKLAPLSSRGPTRPWMAALPRRSPSARCQWSSAGRRFSTTL